MTFLLKKIAILRDRVEDWQTYPFTVPAIAGLKELTLKSRACFFAGENGTGKSTLLEAIAAHYGFGREGGNRNFQNDSTESNHSVDPLVRALRLSFDRRTGEGYFLRAESFFNTVSHMDALDKEASYSPRCAPSTADEAYTRDLMARRSLPSSNSSSKEMGCSS